jgi:hypothetical protein
MKISTSHTILATATAFAIYSGSANAATIAVVGTGQASASGLNATDAVATLNYTLKSGGNVLVLGAYIDFSSPAAEEATITFDGFSPNARITSDRGTMAYFKPDALDTSVTIRVTSKIADYAGFVLWELSNVDLTATVASAAGGDTITTSVANTFVVGFGFVNGTTTPTISATGAVYTATDITPFLIGNNPGAGTIGGASGLAASAGSNDISWANDGNGSVLAYGFVAIPEPSVALLGGLGLLALLRRRR